ncbi:uncharacterized protein BO95DRAFT_256671 [Aspergillus brunneoviolaceus CBS 621.78]|uniref:Uncharacterized protein n=1 Tax=Aspergillus brunneoviolaceus CBS 621.78 TaxID=1450534 RepID=A0ACD1FXT6_9EURO|nr:hypothetical protein BO95DRAFT_256671 [Aspergillus brunneoviolaceus CBS 621.78]RAH41767.1 hypothetical protein BO95DRAFT_256671 [Aspergillus brunneoviolaceus CBS 621.78]
MTRPRPKSLFPGARTRNPHGSRSRSLFPFPPPKPFAVSVKRPPYRTVHGQRNHNRGHHRPLGTRRLSPVTRETWPLLHARSVFLAPVHPGLRRLRERRKGMWEVRPGSEPVACAYRVAFAMKPRVRGKWSPGAWGEFNRLCGNGLVGDVNWSEGLGSNWGLCLDGKEGE